MAAILTVGIGTPPVEELGVVTVELELTVKIELTVDVGTELAELAGVAVVKIGMEGYQTI